MDHSQQVDAIREMLLLEEEISNKTNELSVLENTQYQAPPAEPVRQMVQRAYPEIVPPKTSWLISFSVPLAGVALVFIAALLNAIVRADALVLTLMMVGFLLIFPGIAWTFVHRLVIKKKNDERYIADIAASEDYRKHCAALDAQWNAQQAQLDTQYSAEKQDYDNRILPAYIQAFEEWRTEQNEKIAHMQAHLAEIKERLSELYDSSLLVPMRYRNIEALRYVYEIVSTSNYDVQAGIESYEKHLQRTLDAQRLQEQQRANRIADEQNALIAEQNEISEKARRDANIAAVAGFVQRHNTNKALNNILKK